MAIGKESLGRVAKAGPSAPDAVEKSADLKQVKVEPAPEKKIAPQKASIKKEVKRPNNAIYAVGDKLPEYLL